MGRHKKIVDSIVKDRGVTTEEKGVFIPIEKRSPFAPDNIKLSKAQFLEKQRLIKEKKMKLQEVADQFDKEQGLVSDAKKLRPKAIEK